jgi:DNA primase
MIKQSSIEALKSRLDVVDVVGSYIELKKAGANFKCICPFHDEKSPSMVISPSKQIYHCFGCGMHGDSIKFTMEYEKLNYPEALEKLARDFNFSLEYEKGKSSDGGKNNTLDILQALYLQNIEHNNRALTYLTSRGIHNSSHEKFGIGYAPSSAEQLQYLQNKLIPMPQAIASGAIASDDKGRPYSRFIERVTFPIHSHSGKVIGFGGRTLTNHPAKYINSPQSDFFNKSRILYAYHLAKEFIYKRKEIIVTEGYMDVVMLHQAGFNTAVATLGTALTKEHLPMIRKGDPHVILAYDGDKAGRAAALKAATMLSQANFEGGVVLFEQGNDPADMVELGRVDELKTLFSHPKKLIEFVIETTINEFDINSPEARQHAFNSVRAYLKSLPALLQESYRTYAAQLLKTNEKFFTFKQHPNKEQLTTTQPQSFDLSELTLLKTLLQGEFNLEDVFPLLDDSMFEHHFDLYMLIKAQDNNNPQLSTITLNDNLHIMSREELAKRIIQLQIQYWQKKLRWIQTNSEISFKEKSFKLRKVQEKIKFTRAGKITPLEF